MLFKNKLFSTSIIVSPRKQINEWAYMQLKNSLIFRSIIVSRKNQINEWVISKHVKTSNFHIHRSLEEQLDFWIEQLYC